MSALDEALALERATRALTDALAAHAIAAVDRDAELLAATRPVVELAMDRVQESWSLLVAGDLLDRLRDELENSEDLGLGTAGGVLPIPGLVGRAGRVVDGVAAHHDDFLPDRVAAEGASSTAITPTVEGTADTSARPFGGARVDGDAGDPLGSLSPASETSGTAGDPNTRGPGEAGSHQDGEA